MKVRTFIAGLTMATMAFVLYHGCTTGDETAVTKSKAAQPLTYVGSASCQGCHAEAFDKWEESHHYHAMELPNAKSVLGDFNNSTFEADGLKTFDCVIANPPFSLKDWGAENWANDPYGRNIAGVPPKGNGDMAWVQHMVKSMNSTGRMTVVLPHGALFRKAAEGKIRKQLLEQDMLEAVIGLGPNVFYGTQLAACVMVFKQNKPADKKGKVLFIDASDQIRVGRAQNFLEPNHVQQIYDWYHNYQDVENYVKVASKADLEENDFNLNLPLYVEKIIEDNLPSVEEAMSDLKQAWQASLDAEEKFKQVLARFI